MKNSIITILILLTHLSHAQENIFFDKMDAFLNKYMTDGQIDYQAIKSDPKDLNELYDLVGNMSTEGKTEAFGKAFHINAYNLLVIKQVTVFYPISGPFDVNGFFDNIKHEVCKDELTLDELEKEFMLPSYDDARIHFALVCAAKGCPPLLDQAYRPELLEEQLEAKAKKMINSNGFVTYSNNEVTISKIFDWYSDEFAATSGSVVEYLNQYRVEKIPVSSKVSYYEYDWSLNDFQN